MRWCSRSTGEASSAWFGCGIGRLACCVSGSAAQAASAKASATSSVPVRQVDDDVTFAPIVLIDQFDLFRTVHLDQRAAPQIEPAADPHPPVLECGRRETGSHEIALPTPGNQHGEIARPSIPEIQIYSGSARVHRQDLALDQNEVARERLQARQVVRRKRGETWV